MGRRAVEYIEDLFKFFLLLNENDFFMDILSCAFNFFIKKFIRCKSVTLGSLVYYEMYVPIEDLQKK
jgi:hypothetical protein